MTDVAIREGEGAPSPPLKIKRHWSRRLAGEVATLLVVLLILLSIGLVALDTAPGHRWLVDRLQQIETQSGLRFRIGRIEGSIFSESRLRNVKVLDRDGVFLTSPEITLDWSPLAWLTNSLTIDRLEADRLRLERLPKLRPTGRKGPILPKFDIHIGKLEIRRFEVAPGVAGQARVGKLSGSADIRSGRAVVRLNGALVGGDRLLVNLDAEPDGNRFDLDIRGSAPANGLLPALFGSKRPLKLVVEGDGTWKRWRGRALMDLAGKPTARLALGADNGRYQLNGQVAAEPFFKGKVLRLTAPIVTVRGSGTFLQRQLDGELRLSSPSLRAVARGRVDLAEGAYRQLRLGIDLLRPPALFKNMTGQNVRLVWTLDGTFGRADYSYRLTSPSVKFDNTGFVDVRAEGRGRAGPWPMRVPMRMQARAVTGVGDVAGAILANVRIEGMLSVTPALVRGDSLALRSDKLSGKMSLLIDLKTGRFDVVISGGLTRYLIPGLGIVDVKSDLHVVPGPGGKARVLGKAEAVVRRLDNSFFLSLTGSLPRLTTDLERTTDGVLHFSNLQLYSRDLRLSGTGIRRRDGTFHIEARGKQAKYGPLRLILDGHIERPRLNILLDHPNQAMGLTNVGLLLDPTPAGFDYMASGNSKLGRFTSLGRILLPKGGRTVISIAALNVAGTMGHGDLRADPGGFSGLLALAGGGINGTLTFSPVNDAQKIEAHLTASNARIPGNTLTTIRAGKLDGTILLEEGRTSLDGTAIGRGINYGAVTLARVTLSGRVVNGSGRIRAALAGRRGQAFELVTIVDLSPDQIKLTGRGQVDRRELVLESPAILTRGDGGWRIAPTRVRFAGGQATLSGSTGNHPELHAVVQAMPLELLDMLWPNLDLSGSANGRLDYSWRGAGGVPSGRADLRIRRLTRAGLVLSSKPIDVGLAAVLSGGKAALRAVAVSDGKTIGRAQARFGPLAAGQPIVAALANAPMLLQVRYAGPADTLWRLSGVEVFDLSGPIAIGADINGRLVDPVIRGSLKTQNARIESAVTGMVITGLNASGRFGGPRLVLDNIAGRTAGGSISGTGTVNFSGGSPAFDLDFNVQKAQLLGRDDLAATVTGPISIHSSGRGGRISGQLHLDKGRFTLGKASASASVPQLKVRHVGRDEEEVIEIAQLAPWNLDVTVSGRDLTVRGLGIDSLWRTNLSIGGTVAAPRLTGEANLDRGEYEFAGRSFRLERGVIRFRGESPVNPTLDIRAEAQVQGLDASVNVRGTGLKPEITFASVPALPQDELLSRILFGTSITNLSAPEAVQLASAIAALQSGNGSLDPINAVRRAVGLDRLRIVPADVATGQKTAISAGKYLGRKLFVEVITDGQGYSATRVEYQVTRWLSVLSSISTIGRASANVRISKDY
jgi:translocation and assembly module TamB